MKLKEGFEIKENELEFKLDSEFVNLCNSLLGEELEKLENSIKTEGCRDPLVIWEEEGILLDGHHRLYFCQQNKKPYQIYKKSFPDRFSALLWTWKNDKGRRGSGDSKYYDAETVVLKFKDELEKRAKKHLKTATNGMRGGSPLTRGSKAINVRIELARLAHVSEQTINRAEFIMKYADEEIRKGLRERRSKLQFRALAEKYMMLYPEKQDSEEELEFKKTLDKETILEKLNLPQAQTFVETLRKIKNVTPEQQKIAVEKVVEAQGFKEAVHKSIMQEKYPYEEKEAKEKEFAEFIEDCAKLMNTLNRKLETIINFKSDFDSAVYKKTFARFEFDGAINMLQINLKELIKEDK